MWFGSKSSSVCSSSDVFGLFIVLEIDVLVLANALRTHDILLLDHLHLHFGTLFEDWPLLMVSRRSKTRDWRCWWDGESMVETRLKKEGWSEGAKLEISSAPTEVCPSRPDPSTGGVILASTQRGGKLPTQTLSAKEVYRIGQYVPRATESSTRHRKTTSSVLILVCVNLPLLLLGFVCFHVSYLWLNLWDCTAERLNVRLEEDFLCLLLIQSALHLPDWLAALIIICINLLARLEDLFASMITDTIGFHNHLHFLLLLSIHFSFPEFSYFLWMMDLTSRSPESACLFHLSQSAFTFHEFAYFVSNMHTSAFIHGLMNLLINSICLNLLIYFMSLLTFFEWCMYHPAFFNPESACLFHLLQFVKLSVKIFIALVSSPKMFFRYKIP